MGPANQHDSSRRSGCRHGPHSNIESSPEQMAGCHQDRNIPRGARTIGQRTQPDCQRKVLVSLEDRKNAAEPPELPVERSAFDVPGRTPSPTLALTMLQHGPRGNQESRSPRGNQESRSRDLSPISISAGFQLAPVYMMKGWASKCLSELRLGLTAARREQ